MSAGTIRLKSKSIQTVVSILNARIRSYNDIYNNYKTILINSNNHEELDYEDAEFRADNGALINVTAIAINQRKAFGRITYGITIYKGYIKKEGRKFYLYAQKRTDRELSSDLKYIYDTLGRILNIG
jgi:hypothetical protein